MNAPRQVTTRAAALVAPNPGPMTLEGTNTWLLRAPDCHAVIVVDPGPQHEGHLGAVAGAGSVALILLTHGHLDHSEGARRLHELTGAPVRALDPAHRLSGKGLVEGDVVAAAGIEVEVLATPGHSEDSLCFYLREDNAVMTGDTVVGRGTTLVTHPDGRLADYLRSLQRLRALGNATVLPGHGPELASASVIAQAYLDHRAKRLAQVRGALAAGDETPQKIVRRVYTDVDPVLWPAAELSAQAQLDFLRRQSSG